MSQKIPTVKVRALRGVYYLDALPNEAWSRQATHKAPGQVFLAKLRDAIEMKTAKKIEFVAEAADQPAPAVPNDLKPASKTKHEPKA